MKRGDRVRVYHDRDEHGRPAHLDEPFTVFSTAVGPEFYNLVILSDAPPDSGLFGFTSPEGEIAAVDNADRLAAQVPLPAPSPSHDDQLLYRLCWNLIRACPGIDVEVLDAREALRLYLVAEGKLS